LTATLNAVMLGLLATPSIPLRTTFSAIEVVRAQGVAICHPTETQRRQATSKHVLAFDNNSRELILCESSGEFTVEEWDDVVDSGQKERSAEKLLREEIGKMLGVPTEG
jgi:ribonuclease PH